MPGGHPGDRWISAHCSRAGASARQGIGRGARPPSVPKPPPLVGGVWRRCARAAARAAVWAAITGGLTGFAQTPGVAPHPPPHHVPAVGAADGRSHRRLDPRTTRDPSCSPPMPAAPPTGNSGASWSARSPRGRFWSRTSADERGGSGSVPFIRLPPSVLSRLVSILRRPSVRAVATAHLERWNVAERHRTGATRQAPAAREHRFVRVAPGLEGSPRTIRRREKPDNESINGRGGEIRTHDLLYPKQARYQATLRPEPCPAEGTRHFFRSRLTI